MSHWLFVKYDMSYKTYRNKSKERRDELRIEFEADTGVNLADKRKKQTDYEYENAMELLAETGVPFTTDGTPPGIGWDD